MDNYLLAIFRRTLVAFILYIGADPTSCFSKTGEDIGGPVGKVLQGANELEQKTEIVYKTILNQSSARCTYSGQDNQITAQLRSKLNNFVEETVLLSNEIASAQDSLPKYASDGEFEEQLAQAGISDATSAFISSKFHIADAYLAIGCASEADLLYRGILDQYVGSDYEAYRERAIVGIDDVREFRGLLNK